MRTITRLLAAVPAGLLVLGLCAPLASATPPVGSCAGPYEPYTLSELIDLAESTGRTEQLARGTFTRVNKNGDGLVCVKALRDNPKSNDRFNFADNVASSRS